MTRSLSGRHAVLYLPASRPSAIVRARVSGADMVILDLEDAVREEDKDAARDAAVAALDEAWPMPVGLRVNAPGTASHDADVAALAASRADFAVVPMVADPASVAAIRAHGGKPVLAMIESAAGVLAAPAIAREAAGLIVGTNDLRLDLGIPDGPGRSPIQFALQAILVAARAAGIAAYDGVFNRLDDPDGLAAECAESRALGFDGKSLIHPDHITACQSAFAPTPDELTRARRLIAAATTGAQRFEGQMIEALHVEAARRLIADTGP